MHREIKSLMNDFVKSLDPIKSEVYSLVLHGSGVYSKDLKRDQDLDLMLVFKKYDIQTLKKFRNILKDFCKAQSGNEKEVYFSIAGDGRGSISKNYQDTKQSFKLEIFPSSEIFLSLNWRTNSMFPHFLAKTSKILFGEDVREFAKYSGYSGLIKSKVRVFNKLQWMYCSVLESGYDEKLMRSSCQESIFNSLRTIFEVYGINEKDKDNFAKAFKKNFPKHYKKFGVLLDDTINIRKSLKPKMDVFDYLHGAEDFDKFSLEAVYEKLG